MSGSLVVAGGHEAYRTLTLKQLKALCRHATSVLADVKSLYDRHEAAKEGFTVFPL